MPNTKLREYELAGLKSEYDSTSKQQSSIDAKARELAGAGNEPGYSDLLAIFQSWQTGETLASHFPVPVLRDILVWIEQQARAQDLAWTALHYDLYAQNPTVWDRILSKVPNTRIGLVVRFTVYQREPEDPTGSKTLEKFRSALGSGLPALRFYNAAGQQITGLPLGVSYCRVMFTVDSGFKLGTAWSRLMSAVKGLNDSKIGLVNPPVLVFDAARVKAQIRELAELEPEPKPGQPGSFPWLFLAAIGGAFLLHSPWPLVLLLVQGTTSKGSTEPGGKRHG